MAARFVSLTPSILGTLPRPAERRGSRCSPTKLSQPRLNPITNQETVKEYVRAFNVGDIEALRKVFAPDALIHGVMGWGPFDKVAPMWTALHHSFNMRLEIEQTVESGENVAVRFTERGHFVNEFRGQQPTNQTSEVVAIEWFQMEDGLIKRRWGVRDSASHFKQLGVAA